LTGSDERAATSVSLLSTRLAVRMHGLVSCTIHLVFTIRSGERAVTKNWVLGDKSEGGRDEIVWGGVGKLLGRVGGNIIRDNILYRGKGIGIILLIIILII